MLPAKIENKCKHLKIYKEKYLMRTPACFHWRCVKCKSEGVGDDKIEFIHTYAGILRIRKIKPYRYNEE